MDGKTQNKGLGKDKSGLSMSRRKLLKVILAGGAAQLLAACGLSKTPAPTSTSTKIATPSSTAQSIPLQPTTQPSQIQLTMEPITARLNKSSKDPILFIVGDLVSRGSVDRAQKVISLIQTLMAQHPGTEMLVACVGDNEQEGAPTLSDYQTYFDSTYGVFVREGIFRPVRGNHDIYDIGHGQAYSEYFNAVTHFGEIQIDDGQLNYNYSFDLGSWHIIGIDQPDTDFNPSGLDFLKSDLAEHAAAKGKLVFWHVPTYCSSYEIRDNPALIPLNRAAYDAGVDIQVNGHAHIYQRFYPINPAGQRDDAGGITTFIAGIGGEDYDYGFRPSSAEAASAVFMNTFPGGNGNHAIGVLMFTLHDGWADYALYNANDNAILDQGTVFCHQI